MQVILSWRDKRKFMEDEFSICALATISYVQAEVYMINSYVWGSEELDTVDAYGDISMKHISIVPTLEEAVTVFENAINNIQKEDFELEDFDIYFVTDEMKAKAKVIEESVINGTFERSSDPFVAVCIARDKDTFALDDNYVPILGDNNVYNFAILAHEKAYNGEDMYLWATVSIDKDLNTDENLSGYTSTFDCYGFDALSSNIIDSLIDIYSDYTKKDYTGFEEYLNNLFKDCANKFNLTK